MDEVSEANGVTLEVGVELGGVEVPVEVAAGVVPVGLEGGEPVGLAVWVDEVGVEDTAGLRVRVPVGSALGVSVAEGVPVSVEGAAGLALSVGVWDADGARVPSVAVSDGIGVGVSVVEGVGAADVPSEPSAGDAKGKRR